MEYESDLEIYQSSKREKELSEYEVLLEVTKEQEAKLIQDDELDKLDLIKLLEFIDHVYDYAPSQFEPMRETFNRALVKLGADKLI